MSMSRCSSSFNSWHLHRIREDENEKRFDGWTRQIASSGELISSINDAKGHLLNRLHVFISHGRAVNGEINETKRQTRCTRGDRESMSSSPSIQIDLNAFTFRCAFTCDCTFIPASPFKRKGKCLRWQKFTPTNVAKKASKKSLETLAHRCVKVKYAEVTDRWKGKEANFTLKQQSSSWMYNLSRNASPSLCSLSLLVCEMSA